MKAEWERGAPGRGRELWESGQLRFRELPWGQWFTGQPQEGSAEELCLPMKEQVQGARCRGRNAFSVLRMQQEVRVRLMERVSERRPSFGYPEKHD